MPAVLMIEEIVADCIGYRLKALAVSASNYEGRAQTDTTRKQARYVIV